MATFSTQTLLTLPRAAPALYARYGRHVPMIASLVLVIVIARLLAHLVWVLIPTPAAAAWKPIPPPLVTSGAGNAVDINAITNAALFGTFAPPATPVLADITSAPDTQLNLTLLGILADGRRPEDSRALIGTQGGDEKPYSVGDDITRGVTLQAIFPDRVILLRNGKPETLRLDKDAVGAAGLLPSTLPVQEQPAQAANTAAALGAIRSQLLTDPSKVADYIRVQPVNTGNGVNGYRIYPGKDRSLFTAAGLRPGDIVTAVNGVQLNDPGKSLQLLSDLSQNTQLNLTVDRGGQPQNFNLNLGQ